MQQPAWIKPYARLDLTGVRLDGVYIGNQGRAATDAEARRRNVSLRHITPAFTAWGRIHVLQFGRGTRPNTVLLAAADPAASGIEVELEASSSCYRLRVDTRSLSALIDQVTGDYPAGTFPAAIATSVQASVRLFVRLDRRRSHIDAADVRQALLCPLAGFLTAEYPAWLHLDDGGVFCAQSLAAGRADQTTTPDVRMLIDILSALLGVLHDSREADRTGRRPYGDSPRVRDLDEATTAALGGVARIVSPLPESSPMERADHEWTGDEDLRPMPYRAH
jgi:hypothetical protein